MREDCKRTCVDALAKGFRLPADQRGSTGQSAAHAA